MANGSVVVDDVDEADLEEEAGEPEYEAMKAFLEQVKTKDLPQA